MNNSIKCDNFITLRISEAKEEYNKLLREWPDHNTKNRIEASHKIQYTLGIITGLEMAREQLKQT